jgi:hypothetical protein
MDHPMPLDQVKVGIMDDQQVNAANAGGNQFFVTTGLLHKASDDRLRAVLAHELSHQDLNHVAKAQVLAAGLGIGAAILDQIFPGTGAITLLAGQLVTSQYSRSEVRGRCARRRALRRADYPKKMMVDTLTWLLRVSGPGSGGFATHPRPRTGSTRCGRCPAAGGRDFGVVSAATPSGARHPRPPGSPAVFTRAIRVSTVSPGGRDPRWRSAWPPSVLDQPSGARPVLDGAARAVGRLLIGRSST